MIRHHNRIIVAFCSFDLVVCFMDIGPLMFAIGSGADAFYCKFEHPQTIHLGIL